mgnify:FL=1
MITVIFVYLLIGWIIGFISIIFRAHIFIKPNWIVDGFPFIILCVLYWPWVLVECIIFLITDIGNKE